MGAPVLWAMRATPDWVQAGFPKKGTKSVGVKRQYSGTLGRTENCQVGVFLGYHAARGHTLLDRRLFLPEEWAGDGPRREAAGVPDGVIFRTKPELALAMVADAVTAGLPFRWVAGDSVYGDSPTFCQGVRALGKWYVLDSSADARVCLDPFQVFDSVELRLRYGVGFITLLTATPPGSTAAALCYRAAQHTVADAAANGRQPRLRDVIAALETDGGASELVDKLRALSDISYGRLVFGDVGPAVNLDGDYVCFHVPGLRLPRATRARDEQLPEELLGQAILYLVTAFSRRLLFRDTSRFAALLLDEAHAVTSSAQGRELVLDLIRDGRKHFAAVWAFSQLPADLTADDGEGIDTLLGYRMVFRQSRQTAGEALRFVGSDDRDANLETILALGTGECLMRDPTGRLGLVRIAVPDDPAVVAAFSTTPGDIGRVMIGPWPSLDQTESPAAGAAT